MAKVDDVRKRAEPIEQWSRYSLYGEEVSVQSTIREQISDFWCHIRQAIRRRLGIGEMRSAPQSLERIQHDGDPQ